MSRFLLDTSCMVAAVCGWHEHHDTAREVERRLDEGEDLVLAAPALVETYAVLTRLPAPHRLSPAVSLALLEANFLAEDAEVIALDTDAYVRLLRTAPELGVAGGAMHCAVIVACALLGKADTLLTLNERQFRALASPGIRILVPV